MPRPVGGVLHSSSPEYPVPLYSSELHFLTNYGNPPILTLCNIRREITMGRAMKINITLPEDELSRIDKYVQQERTTRSGLILQALRTYIEGKEEEAEERGRRLAIQRASSDIRKLRAKVGKWDGVAEIRKWRDAT